MSHPHPYYDYKVGDQVAITTLAGPCIAFDEGLADFIHLVRTTTDKDLVITIPPKARLTPAFDRLVDATLGQNPAQGRGPRGVDEAHDGRETESHEDGQRNVLDPHDAPRVLVPGGEEEGA